MWERAAKRRSARRRASSNVRLDRVLSRIRRESADRTSTSDSAQTIEAGSDRSSFRAQGVALSPTMRGTRAELSQNLTDPVPVPQAGLPERGPSLPAPCRARSRAGCGRSLSVAALLFGERPVVRRPSLVCDLRTYPWGQFRPRAGFGRESRLGPRRERDPGSGSGDLSARIFSPSSYGDYGALRGLVKRPPFHGNAMSSLP